MKQTLKEIVTGTLVACALLGSGCNRQQILEDKWNQAVARGSIPYLVQVSEHKVNEYLDTNLDGTYDLAISKSGIKKIYSEIPETSLEQLRK